MSIGIPGLCFAVAIGLAVVGPARAEPVPLEGVWRTEDGADAALYPCGDALCLKVVTGEATGLLLSSDLVADGRGGYAGSLFNPHDGKTYSGTASPAGGDTMRLKGCTAFIFCKTQTWTRVR